MQYLITTFDNGLIEWNTKADLLKMEAAYIWSIYKAGTLKNIWFSDTNDALLIIESENKDKANDIVNNLPLVKSNLIKYTITSLFPYTGIERLIDGTD